MAGASVVTSIGPLRLNLMGSKGLGLPDREVTLQRPSSAHGTGASDKLAV